MTAKDIILDLEDCITFNHKPNKELLENAVELMKQLQNNQKDSKNLPDNEIIKALKHCADTNCNCEKCSLYVASDDDCECARELKLEALNLINRLQAENEQKDRAFENLIEVARLWKEKYNNAKEELFNKTEQLKTAKAEAYKEFAERLKERIHIKKDKLFYGMKIHNLLKEMVGADNG